MCHLYDVVGLLNQVGIRVVLAIGSIGEYRKNPDHCNEQDVDYAKDNSKRNFHGQSILKVANPSCVDHVGK